MSYAVDGAIDQPGWRLRVGRGDGPVHLQCVHRFLGPERRKPGGDNVFADPLVGYRFQLAQSMLKVFPEADSKHHFIDHRSRRSRHAHERDGVRGETGCRGVPLGNAGALEGGERVLRDDLRHVYD
jgi:hypothetical protein